MVSLRQKRSRNVYEEDITTDESDCDYEYKIHTNEEDHSKLNGMSIKKAKVGFPYSTSDYDKMSQSGRRPKCYSKNALMARENRIKKKMHLQNLEESVEKYRDENKKLSSILDNQSSVIKDLRKEVKYLKNVLANSTDIGRLLKSINQNTGLPVTTSINNNIKFSAPLKRIHPWAEEKQQFTELNTEFDEFSGEFTSLLSDFANDSKLDDLFSDLSPLENEVLPEVPIDENLDHTYSNALRCNEDVGVCLHIAKHKVSLEFCSSCSENASSAWDED